MRGEARDRPGERHERLRHAETKTGRNPEDESIDRLRKVGPVGHEQRRQWFQRLLHYRHQKAEEKQRADVNGCAAQRVAYARERVVGDALDQSEHQTQNGAAADRESEHRGRLVAIDLRLEEVDQVQDRYEESRDEDRGGDQPGDVQDEDPGDADRERPSELMDLALAEVRKQGREH